VGSGLIDIEGAFMGLDAQKLLLEFQIRNPKNLVSVCSDWQHHLASFEDGKQSCSPDRLD
jgi:hypothetical protein